MPKLKVVLAGAAGYLAGRMLPELRRRYELTLLDVTRTNRRSGETVDGTQMADLTVKDRDAYRRFFRGKDAVIHCGYLRADRKDPEAHFEAELKNIQMAFNLYRLCQEEDVKRIVVFSSNHAADYHERVRPQPPGSPITTAMLPLSDSVYGWAKSAYENLGFTFACGRTNGKRVENIHLRIGSPWEWRFRKPDGPDRLQRYLGAYLSVRDQTQLVSRSIEAESIEDQNGVPHHIFYGISGNTERFWSIDNACRVVGYAPEDDCSVRFAKEIREMTQAESV